MKTKTVIPYGRQNIDDGDIQAVVDVLKSDYLTTGPAIEKFEKLVAEYCGVKYAVAVTNATAALQIAAQALDLKSGDQLWTSPNTFVASANAAEHTGADANFVDIDPTTLNLSAKELEKKLKATPVSERPKIIIPVHFAGQSCDMKAIAELAKQYDFKIIEDAAHAIGSIYDGNKVGSCKYSSMTVFSFHPVKNITTGEGGMITTNDSELAERLRELRTIGITRNPARMSKKSEGPWYYEQREISSNFRLTDIGAALGISQLKRLESFIERRNKIVDRYNTELADLPLLLPKLVTGERSAWHLYVIQVQETSKLNRLQLFEALRERGIGVNVHYIPVHLQPVYRAKGFKAGDYPNAEKYYSNAISLPIFFELTDEQQTYVIEQLKELLLN